MKLHDLRPAPGSKRPAKRIGRGVGSGHGVTAGRGTKGQKARAGFKMIPGFEGGQIRMIKRLPYKRGFTNAWRVEYEVFNVGLLGRRFEADAQVDLDSLREAGLRTTNQPVKILGDGEISVALNVTAHKVSPSARQKIEAAGGTINELGIKEPQGKKRPIDARDVTLKPGEVVRVRSTAQESKESDQADA